MNKKLLLKYILIYMPFILGITLYSVGVVNLISSLFLFVGGYYAIKNTFDYRVVKKNIKKCKMEIKKEDNNYLPGISSIEPIRINRVKRNIRVRKREKK